MDAQIARYVLLILDAEGSVSGSVYALALRENLYS